MSYLAFHLAFIVPVILGLALVPPRPITGAGPTAAWKRLTLIAGVALLYTTPWDNYLVWRGVWAYGEDRVLAVIGYVPVEEYAFFVLQPFLAGLWYFRLRATRPVEMTEAPARARPLATSFWLLLSLSGILMLAAESPRLTYMGLILSWAAPVLAGMSWLGVPLLWAERKRLVLAVAAPTLYLWIVDRIAIALGIWDISDEYSLGFDPLGLPIEEAVFFLLTHILVVQGLAMLMPVPDRTRTKVDDRRH